MEMIQSTQNETVRLFRKAGLLKREDSLFPIEGEKILREALLNDIEIEVLLYDPARLAGDEIVGAVRARGGRVFPAAPHVLESICDTKTPQGCAALCRKTDVSFKKEAIRESGIYLVLEDLQDPGNAGAILRSARAFWASGVILAGKSCNVYSPKLIRAAAGALFSGMAFECAGAIEAGALLRDKGYLLVGTGLTADARPAHKFDPPEKVAIFIGSEGQGLQKETLAFCDDRIRIPMQETSESLNAAVAASILLWEFGRGKRT